MRCYLVSREEGEPVQAGGGACARESRCVRVWAGGRAVAVDPAFQSVFCVFVSARPLTRPPHAIRLRPPHVLRPRDATVCTTPPSRCSAGLHTCYVATNCCLCRLPAQLPFSCLIAPPPPPR